MITLEKYRVYTEGNKEILNWVNTVLRAHLKKENVNENQTEIEHILDFLKSDKAPKRLRKMSYEQAKSSAEKWNKTLMKKGAHIAETEEDTEIVLGPTKSGIKLVKLKGYNAFKREGHIMRHCVASYYDKEDCEIYSLRDAKNNPHCTIEVKKDNGEIYQIKGKGNGSIHPRYIKYVMKILKYFGMNIRVHDMKNLGYERLSNDLTNYIIQNFEGYKTLNINKDLLFYKDSLKNLKRKV